MRASVRRCQPQRVASLTATSAQLSARGLNVSAQAALTTKANRLEMPPTDFKPMPYTGPSFDEVKALRAQHMPSAIFAFYKNPIMLVEGKMQYMWDEKGRRYLDLFGGIVTVSVGHCHPRVTEAGVAQLKKLQHSTTIYYNPEVALFAKELADRLPSQLSVVYFVNSGSEANDLAMLMARAATGNFDFVALRNGYHGMSMNTMGLTALHTWKYNQPQGFGIHHAVCPNTYRGPYGPDEPDVAQKYASDVADIIRSSTSGRVAGWISETIQGVGGTVVLPDGYLKEVYKTVRGAGGVCIADEVQTGFARLGSHYWGFQTQNVIPDIVTMAKGIGNGAPLAAVATTPEIAETLKQRVHFNTYGGNPVSCAMGRAVLKVVDEEGIQHKALSHGAYFTRGLNELKRRYPIIGEVRGKGLMLGVELVKDQTTKEPATAETADIFERAKDMGLLIGKGGLYGNVFRIKPPMCITKHDIDFSLEVLDQAFKDSAKAM
ncbi:alanineglyoxylate aminotransferase [Acanthamoeba castellanii str. Neff]|uniref:alanine--glyoxylate transaminase n=1 Tax=Acanthamoeba castellanii (strain ATCC 30010 / Neff) TaxID=1257118 RepID=L8HDR8_ACACF|nr:alanineglyoxylate aminotransferase [Acanthamoeba castellanii str. Neff]ELR23649.1 alanineglyoxylate aminotransferase [Acanthamoeba castellanii str. Neff]